MTLLRKTCSKCMIEKSVEHFYWQKQRSSHTPECRECAQERTRESYRAKANDKEFLRKKALSCQRYYSHSKDRVLKQKKAYYAETADERREYSRAYKESRKNTPEWRGKVQRWNRLWRVNHPVERRLHNGARRLKMRGARIVKEDIHNWESKVCGICSRPIEEKFHIDHITPLSRGGLHEVSNLQLAHPHCNLVKNNKLDVEVVI